MTDTKLDETWENTDTYNIYHCTGCGNPYQLAVRQWKGTREEVKPARICRHCLLDSWMCVEKTSLQQERRKGYNNNNGRSSYAMASIIGTTFLISLSQVINTMR